ncbi:MAG: amidohydrolase family protein [Acidimicrobiales bacterium]
MSPVIDVHHHFLPDGVVARLRRKAGGGPRLVDDRISITLHPALSDVDAHLAAMDEAGVDLALLTYSGVSVLGPEVCREVNEGLAAVVAAHPGRLRAAAHVDLEDAGATDELARCVDDLGFGAVALPSSTPTVALDDPTLDPLWAAIGELDVPVVLHPALLPRGASTDHGLERSCARPFDTTVAAVRLVCGVLPRHRSLRVVFPHCGGTAIFLKGRLQMFFGRPGEPPPSLPRTVAEQARDGLDAIFDELWSQLWFDTAGTGGWAPAVTFAASVVGADRLMWGSDFPLESHSAATLRELVTMVGDLPLPPDERAAVAGGTAAALLSIPPAGAGAAGAAAVGASAAGATATRRAACG